MGDGTEKTMVLSADVSWKNGEHEDGRHKDKTDVEGLWDGGDDGGFGDGDVCDDLAILFRLVLLLDDDDLFLLDSD